MEVTLTILTEKNCVQFSARMAAWLLLTFFICLYNQSSSIHFITRIKEYRCLKNLIHQIEGKNEWLLPSANFTAKFGLVFVLTLEDAFSQTFHFKATKSVQVLLKNGTTDFQNCLPFERSTCFYVEIREILNVFHAFKQVFWKTKTFFKKLQYRFSVESTKIENASFP